MKKPHACFSIFLIFDLFVCGLLIYAKWFWYRNYGFTSDVFSYSGALTNTVHGKFMVDAARAFLWANHAYIILLLFVPFYAVIKSAMILLVAGVAAYGIAGYYVFRFSRILLGRDVYALLVGALYLFNPLIIEQALMPLYGFQPDVLAAPLLFAFFTYTVEEKKRGQALCLLLLSLVKEEFALLSCGLIALCILDAVYHRYVPALTLFPSTHPFNVARRGKWNLWLAAEACVLLILSFAILRYAKNFTEFSRAPYLSLREVKDALSWSTVRYGIDFVAKCSRSLLFLPVLVPEITIPAIMRAAINTTVYAQSDFRSIVSGSGFSWSNVTIMNLIFLTFIIALRRVGRMVNSVYVIGIPLCVSLAVTVTALVLPWPIEFKSSIGLFLADYSSDILRQTTNQIGASVAAAKSQLKISTWSFDSIVLISPKLFRDFQEYQAAAFGFTKNFHQSLLLRASGGVVLASDTEALDYFTLHAEFKKVFDDGLVAAFERVDRPEKTSF